MQKRRRCEAVRPPPRLQRLVNLLLMHVEHVQLPHQRLLRAAHPRHLLLHGEQRAAVAEDVPVPF